MSSCRSHLRDVRLLIYIKESLFIDLPGRGQAAPEAQLLIIVNESFKYQGVDFAAGRIRRKDRIQDAGITNGGSEILIETLWIPLGLLLIRGHPEIGLEQEQYKHNGSTYENSADGHGPISLLDDHSSRGTNDCRTYTYYIKKTT